MIERIAVDPKIHFGKPCIKGTRITARNVLELLDDGCSFSQIAQDYYPELTTQDIRACIQYAIALIASEDVHLSAASANGSRPGLWGKRRETAASTRQRMRMLGTSQPCYCLGR